MTNRVWLDVYDNATLLRLGEGPVFSVKGATISRPLDGSGTFRASVVATDARALTLLQPDRIVRIWGEDTAGIRLRGEGLIANWRLLESPAGVGLTVSGPDILEELKRKNTLLGRVYNQQTLTTVTNDLISLAPGWSLALDASIANDIVDARFDGVSVFKAFKNIAKRYGFHFRASLDAMRTLEIGPFGTDTGLRVHKVETIGSEALANPKLLMVQDITQDKIIESTNYFKVLIPTGAGEGKAALTLREAFEENGNVGRKYPIQLLTGPDGDTAYYISTTTYPAGGHTDFRTDPAAAVRVGQYKDIGPLSNSVADRRNASEALYAAAEADLDRSSVVQERFALTVRNAKENILPGDKIRIDYKAQVEVAGHLIDDTELVTYLDVRGDFFVLSSDESVTLDGTSVALEVSNLDRIEQDELELIFDTIDNMEVRNLKPNITAGPPSPYVFSRLLFTGFPVKLPIELTDAYAELLRVRLRIRTDKLVTFLEAQGGDHKHRMAVSQSTLVSQTDMDGFRMRAAKANGSAYDFLLVVEDTVPVNEDLYTEGSSGSLTLNISNPQQDTQTPQSITVKFAGNDVTNDLFGVAALAPSGGAINVLADSGALANLLTDAVGGFQQLHELEIACASGRGQLEVIIEVFATTQATKVGS